MDIFNVGAAEKVESYEICAYESLIRLADEWATPRRRGC